MILVNDTVGIKDNPVTINQNGFAIFEDIKIANSGNIQIYSAFELPNLPPHLLNRDEIRVYRPPKEIKKSVDKFSYLTITDTHPWDNVTIKNYREYGVGLSWQGKI